MPQSWLLRATARIALSACAVASGALAAYLTAEEPRAISEGLSPPPFVDEPLASPAYVARPTAAVVAPVFEPQPAAPPEADPFGSAMQDGMVITGGTEHRLILFTFDDGPDHRYTPGLLDTLDALGIRAVFFLAARRFDGDSPRQQELAAIARDIVARGHWVGSHTMDHVQLPLLSNAELDEQVVGTERVFERVLGARPWLIRPPGGARSARIDAWLASRRYTEVMWNLGTGDVQVRSAEDVLRTFSRVLERRERENGERGGIVLLHDIHEWSVEAVPMIRNWIDRQNCTLLARQQELYDIVDDPRLFFVPRADAAPSDEAPRPVPSPAWLAQRQALLRERAATSCSQIAMR